MEAEGHQSTSVSGPPSSTPSSIVDPFEQQQQEEEIEHNPGHDDHEHQHQRQQPSSGVSYRLSISLPTVASSADVKDNVLFFLVIFLTFVLFASMTVILGFYGSVKMRLGPNCSRLVQVNPLFVQSIKAQEIDESKQGPILYGFHNPPPPDVEITWSETHNAFVESNYHKEWQYFLNKGSKLDISYSVNSPSSAPLSLIIAQGKESLVEWIEDPSYPNKTLSWNIIHGNGMIQQEILSSKTYFIAVGNLNSEEVEVQLNFTIKAFVYNTTQAYYKCYLSHHLCSFKLFLAKGNTAVLAAPGLEEGMAYYDWYIKLSYGPRWIIYLIGSGVMTIFIALAFRICEVFWIIRQDGARFRAGEMGSEQTPLLSQKDDDLSSWGSSYDSLPHDEELDEWLVAASLNGKQLKEGESNTNPQRLCVLCFDALRDCFFLPCGHCAACFTCGTRIIEEAGICPICRRTMKKVRKIFTV